MSLENIHVETAASPRNKEGFMEGIKDCVPTLLGYLSIGLAAGVVQKTAGLSIAEIALMSLILYAGSAQFIAAGMIAASSSPTAIIITILFVNLRHLLLSAALSPYFRHLSPLRNILVGSLLTDETFGVAINQTAKTKKINESWMHGLNITAYLNWFIANIAGALLAQWISDPEKFGLEFALPAMFIGILVLSIIGRSKIKRDIAVALVAVVLTVGCSFFLSSSMGIIVATIIASTLGMAVEKWK
ncbi:AzlC family ABC transporter permease [Peribacillus sp. SI8-4]|uniref:AzlC family ABC transporter permease n=1 Tax=Peribacillus sp. SI8-4 TaxID=3048009 RepID=UPI002556C402|nr:AzlC family ABC transporter permease [Peribacillus sp. SI8-4]